MAFDSKRSFLTYSLNGNIVKTKEEIDKVKIDRLTDYKQALIYGGKTQRFIFDKDRCDAIKCTINMVP
jgi:hypothetical protein